MSTFKELFEENAPVFLGVAMQYVEDIKGVSDVWVYASFEDEVTTSAAVYRINGTFVPMPYCERDLGLSTPMDPMLAIQRCMTNIADEIDDPSELPNSMVVHYAAATEEMRAKFSHDRVPLKKDEPYSAYAMRWAEEFAG